MTTQAEPLGWRYDPEVDALYITYKDGAAIRRTEFVDQAGSVLVDWDDEGTVMGVEILFAFARWPLGELAGLIGAASAEAIWIVMLSKTALHNRRGGSHA